MIHTQKYEVRVLLLLPFIFIITKAMLTIHTTHGTYQTSETKEEILKKASETKDGFISFEWVTKEIMKKEGFFQTCDEVISINIHATPIIAFKEYKNLSQEMPKTVLISIYDEVTLLEKEIEEKKERLDVLNSALTDADYVTYLEHRIISEEARKRYDEKLHQKRVEIGDIQE